MSDSKEEGTRTYWDCVCKQRNSNCKENCQNNNCSYWKCKICNEVVTLGKEHCNNKPETFWFCDCCNSQNLKSWGLWCNTSSSVGRCQFWFCCGCEKVMCVGNKCTCRNKRGPQFWICEIEEGGCGIKNPSSVARCTNESCLIWKCRTADCITLNTSKKECTFCNGCCPPINSGLCNKKHYCYMNSMIWAMHLTNYQNLNFLGFSNDLPCYTSSTVFADLVSEFQKLWTFLDNRSLNTKPYDPTGVLKSFIAASETYYDDVGLTCFSDWYEQNDPTEFLIELLKIVDHFLPTLKNTNNSIELKYRVVCNTCKKTEIRANGSYPFLEITITPKRKDTSMQALLDCYFEGDNKVRKRCEGKCHVESGREYNKVLFLEEDGDGDTWHTNFPCVTLSPSQNFLLVHINGVAGPITFNEDGVIYFTQRVPLSPEFWTLIGAILYTGKNNGECGHYYFVTETYAIDDVTITHDEEHFKTIKKLGYDLAGNHGILFMFKRGGCPTSTEGNSGVGGGSSSSSRNGKRSTTQKKNDSISPR